MLSFLRNRAAHWLLPLILLVGAGCQRAPTADRVSTPLPTQNTPDSAAEPRGAPAQVAPQEIELRVGTDQSTVARVWTPPRSSASPRVGMIFVSGVNGGYEQPVDLIYDRFAQELAGSGVPSVFVQYRNPGELTDSVDDAKAAADYLRAQGVKRMGIAGWSFGGAVSVNSAVQIPEIVTVALFASQAESTEAVESFSRQSLLVIHSKNDENVPYESAGQILELVPRSIHTEFVTLEEPNHILDGTSAKLDPLFRKWLQAELIDRD